ncbi:MAG TPA: hypothetical protein VFN91_15865 [Myxococcaceae bacterium]|nr:hypothetical protein [Myxococcaceae bacterium]
MLERTRDENASNVPVNATKSGVQITAFELDVGIVSEHPAEVTKPGSLSSAMLP